MHDDCRGMASASVAIKEIFSEAAEKEVSRRTIAGASSERTFVD
jgi:hypothetical protein